GFVHSESATNAHPDIGGTGGTQVAVAGATGTFNASISGVNPGTGYVFKGYAINSDGTSYTQPSQHFTTLPASCPYSLSPLDLHVDNLGGPKSVTVTTPNGCPVTAVSLQPWVQVTGISATLNTRTVNLNILQ